MAKYRVVKVTEGILTYFTVQRKFLFWWITQKYTDGIEGNVHAYMFHTEEEAREHISYETTEIETTREVL